MGEQWVSDPHHGGTCQWRYDAEQQRFYHRASMVAPWVVAKRVSLTPKRVCVLAALVHAASTGGPSDG